MLLPDLSSWAAFYYKTGPIIWLLAMLALAGVVLRKRLKPWRVIHWLNYAAFLLAVTHAWLRGSDTQTLGMRIVLVLMAASVVGAFVWKRIKMRKRPAKAS